MNLFLDKKKTTPIIGKWLGRNHIHERICVLKIAVRNRLVKLLGGAILATAVAGSKQSRHYRSYQCNESVGSCGLYYRVTAFVLS